MCCAVGDFVYNVIFFREMWFVDCSCILCHKQRLGFESQLDPRFFSVDLFLTLSSKTSMLGCSMYILYTLYFFLANSRMNLDKLSSYKKGRNKLLRELIQPCTWPESEARARYATYEIATYIFLVVDIWRMYLTNLILHISYMYEGSFSYQSKQYLNLVDALNNTLSRSIPVMRAILSFSGCPSFLKFLDMIRLT